MNKLSQTSSFPPVEVVTASWRDIVALRGLEHICFPQDAWPLWDLVGVLMFPNVIRLKAVAGERMIGFIAGDQRPGQSIAWVAIVCVQPEYQGRGVATALMKACEERLTVKTVRLNVRVSNTRAIRLYEHLGYYRMGHWVAYYQDGEDALVMEKGLPGRVV